MKEYCYAELLNIREKEHLEEVRKFGGNMVAQYEHTKFYLKDVFPPKSSNDWCIEYVIFEIVDKDYLMDVVTGKKYKRCNYQSRNLNTNNKYEIIFAVTGKVASGTVVEQLKRLGKNGALRHKIQMENFEKAFVYGIQLYEQRVYKENQQHDADDDFIRRFRNTYGK